MQTHVNYLKVRADNKKQLMEETNILLQSKNCVIAQRYIIPFQTTATNFFTAFKKQYENYCDINN
jgi:hypothetical protein